MTSNRMAMAAAATVGILVGAALVSSQAISADVAPGTLAFLRYGVGIVVLLLPIAVFQFHRVRFTGKDAAAIALLGIFQFAVLMLLLNQALTRLSATICALVFSTMPLWTVCLALLTRREAFAADKLLGVGLAVGGVVYLLNASAMQGAAHGHVLAGLAALAGATLTGAVTSLLYAPYLRRYAALPTCALAMGAAVVFLSVFCLVTAQPLIPALTAFQWGHVIFIGLSSGVGYFCWLWALGRMDASRVVAFQALGPVTAALIEGLMARRWPPLPLVASLAMVAGGLVLAMWRGRR